jgi:hypothetical protein
MSNRRKEAILGQSLDAVEKHALDRLVGTSGKFRVQVRRQLTVLSPLFDIIDGQARFPPLEQIDPDGIKRSLLSLFGRQDINAEIRIVPAAEFGRLAKDADDYVFLTMHGAAIEFQRISKIMGDAECYQVIAVHNSLATGLAKALIGQFSGYFRSIMPELRAGVVGQYFVFCSAFVGYAMVDDQGSVKRLAPFIRAMAQVVFIGSPKEDPLSWDVLCA